MSSTALARQLQSHPVLTSVAGLYRGGQVELAQVPRHLPEETPVIVTFLESGIVDLPARGIDPPQAAELRARLATFAADWERPEMEVYDHYDAARAR